MCVLSFSLDFPSLFIVFCWTHIISYKESPNMVGIHSTVEKTSKKNARHYSRDYFILFQVTVFLTSFPSCVFSIAEFYNFFPSRFGYGLFQLKRSGNSQKKIRPGNCRSQEALGCDIILYPAWKSTREY